MNYKGRYKFYALIALNIIFLFQLVLFLVFADKLELRIMILLLFILLLCIITTIAVWLGIKRNENKISALPTSYKNTFVDANEIIGLSTLSRQNKHIISDMVLEILEEAHIENRSIEDVISPDLETFIDGFINSMGGQTSFMYLFGYSTFVYTIYLFFMKAYLVFRHGPTSWNSFSEHTLDLGIVVMYGIIAFIFMPWMIVVMQSTAKKQLTGIKKFQVVLPFLLPLLLVTSMILIDADWFTKFMDTPFPILSTPLGIGIAILVSVGSFILMNYARKKQYTKAID